MSVGAGPSAQPSLGRTGLPAGDVVGLRDRDRARPGSQSRQAPSIGHPSRLRPITCSTRPGAIGDAPNRAKLAVGTALLRALQRSRPGEAADASVRPDPSAVEPRGAAGVKDHCIDRGQVLHAVSPALLSAMGGSFRPQTRAGPPARRSTRAGARGTGSLPACPRLAWLPLSASSHADRILSSLSRLLRVEIGSVDVLDHAARGFHNFVRAAVIGGLVCG